MNWYKILATNLDKEFNEQFVKGGITPYIEYEGQTISYLINLTTYKNKDYLALNFISSTGKHKNVLNRFKSVVQKHLNVSGIIYEDVISTKVYNKIKHLPQIPEKTKTKNSLNPIMQKYFDKYYGTFIEDF